jgi:hypothetical protein
VRHPMVFATAGVSAYPLLVPSAAADVDDDRTGHFADVTPISRAPLWYARTVRLLNELIELEPNWDSHQSRPPSPQAHATALRVVRLVPEFGLGAPHIAPVPGGGIDLSWYFDRRRLEVEVLPSGSIEYVRYDQDGSVDDGSIALEHVEEIRDHLRWATN